MRSPLHGGAVLAALLVIALGPRPRQAVRVSETQEAEEAAAAADAAMDARALGLQDVCEERALVKRTDHRHRRSRFGGRPARGRRATLMPCSSLAERKARAGRGPARGEATADDPWEMTTWDKLNLEVGWMLQFLAVVLAIYGFCELSERLTRTSEKALQDSAEAPAPQGLAAMLFGLLWGEGFIGACVTAGIILLSVTNFFFYIWATEVLNEADYKFLDLDWDVVKINRQLEIATTLIFLPITLIRIAVIQYHPQWSVYGSSAHWRYAVTDIYIVAEIVAIAFSTADAVRYACTGKYDHLNLMFVFFGRSFEVLERSGGGLGVRRLRHMIIDDGKLLATAFVMGFVVWILMSGLYFTANRENEHESAVWAVATFHGKPWIKHESIPSTMWWVLINLLKEHPLADAYETFFERLWVCVCCIFAMPVFAIPTSILQMALFKKDADAEQEPDANGQVQVQEGEEEPRESEAEPRPNFWAGVATGVMVYGSAVIYFYYTAKDTRHSKFLGIPVKVTARTWAIVDGTLCAVFCLEWLYRIITQGWRYIFTGMGIIDILAWVPGMEHVSLQFTDPSIVSKWWQSASILRVLKMERYLRAWRDIFQIIRENRGVLAATYLLALLLWMLFTVMIYSTEATNPDPEMRETFGTGMRAIWAELIVLKGEWPWADFTAAGKALGTLVGLFSVMLFCVPTSIFGSAFTQKVQQEVDVEGQDYDRRPWQQLCRPVEEGLSRKVYDLFYAHLHNLTARYEQGFLALRALSFLFVGATTLTTLMGTVPDSSWAKIETTWGLTSYIIDLVATLFFAAEYVGRIVATGWRHPLCIVGLCDALSLVGFIVSLKPSWRDDVFHPSYESSGIWDDVVILLRLLRLFSLESYLSALHTLRNVFVIYCWPLARVGSALISTWFIHAVLLYQLEQQEDAQGIAAREAADDESEVDMGYRYRSVLAALQYSIVHLLGDYPETDYSLLSKVVHVCGIMGGVAIVASFCGVFSGCFVNYLQAERELQFKEAACRRAVVFMSAVRAFQRAFRRRQARRAKGSSMVPAAQPLPFWKRTCRNVAYGMTPTGRRILYFFHAVLLLAILTAMLASLPEAGLDPTLPEADRNAKLDHTCMGIELFCTLVFLVEYFIRVAAYPAKAFTFWRVVDLVCLLPGPLDLLRLLVFGRNSHDTAEAWVQALAMVRAVRILEFQYFALEVGMIGRAIRDAIPKLAVPGYLALCVWITTSALFMWLENYFKDEKGSFYESMTSVPEAMYWCCIFLTGEWANVDFTYAGSRLCILYVIFGVAMFSIPIGIIVEAVQSTVQQSADERKQFNTLIAMSHKKGGEVDAAVFATALRASVAEAAPRHSLAARRRSSERPQPPPSLPGLGGEAAAAGGAGQGPPAEVPDFAGEPPAFAGEPPAAARPPDTLGPPAAAGPADTAELSNQR